MSGTAGCTWLGGVIGELHSGPKSHQTHLGHSSQDFCACTCFGMGINNDLHHVPSLPQAHGGQLPWLEQSA